MSIEDVMFQALKQGYQIDEKTVRHNYDYFKHNLNMCICSICQCGNCQCKNPKFQLPTQYRRRSMTPKVSIRDTPITVSRSFYETYENSYRQMQGLPNQYMTSNQRQYRGFSLTGTPVTSQTQRIHQNQSFDGNTRYNEFYAQKPRQKNVFFKRTYERHTGPMKTQKMETQNQRVFQRVKLEPPKSITQNNQIDSVIRVNFSIPMNTMYKQSFCEMPDIVTTQSIDRTTCKKRKQEDLQCINQIMLPFHAKSIINIIFMSCKIIKKLIMNTYNFNQEQIKQFKELFAMFDKDGGGTISTNEIGNLMKECGENPTPQQLKEMIEEVDVDGNGEVDFDEFIGLMGKRMREEETQEELNQAFGALDLDRDGLLSKSDIQSGLQKLGQPRIPDNDLDELFLKADLDKDGKFSFEEFVRFMTPK